MAAYSKKVFGMFSGVEQKVKIRFENALAGVVIDRFGKDVTMFRTDHDNSQVNRAKLYIKSKRKGEAYGTTDRGYISYLYQSGIAGLTSWLGMADYAGSV